MDRFNSKLDVVEDRISNLENRLVENIQTRGRNYIRTYFY